MDSSGQTSSIYWFTTLLSKFIVGNLMIVGTFTAWGLNSACLKPTTYAPTLVLMTPTLRCLSP